MYWDETVQKKYTGEIELWLDVNKQNTEIENGQSATVVNRRSVAACTANVQKRERTDVEKELARRSDGFALGNQTTYVSYRFSRDGTEVGSQCWFFFFGAGKILKEE